MRKSSKILAVVLAVVLLCAAIATMVSATAQEIIYPEYTAPSMVTKKWDITFDGGVASGGFDAETANGFVASYVDNGNGNYYANITNWVDGEMVEHINYIDASTGNRVGSNKYGNMCNPYDSIVGGSYFVWTFDIMADKYVFTYEYEGETFKELISIEDYETLDDADKANCTPSYTETAYMVEAPKSIDYPYFYITMSNGNWYFTDSTKKQLVALPTEAGVWTNIQMIVKTDLDVRYTADSVETIVPYSEYKAAEGHENATVIVNTVTAVYVNGEYKFDESAATKTNAEYEYATYTNKDGGKFKYAQLKAGKDSDAKVKAPMSICYDNIGGWVYPEGYEGDFATAFENRTSLLDAEDAIFNQNYNKTDSLAATVTTADGTFGYGSVEQAYNAAVDGATIELFNWNNANLTFGTDIKTLTVKTNGKNFSYKLPEGYPYACNETSTGVYAITLEKYASPVYVGPTSNFAYGVNKEFENGSDSVTVDKNIISTQIATLNGNKYAQVSWSTYAGTDSKTLLGPDANGRVQQEQWRPGNLGSNGYAYGLLDNDIFTIEFDFMADQWRNTSTNALMSIEDYNKLSADEQKNYEPAYHNQYFYIEFDNLLDYSYGKAPRITKYNGEWCIYIGSNYAPLPKEAGVWTHISFVYEIGNTVTYYTDDTKTTTATMSYKDYAASGKGETYFVSVNTADTTLSLYVDGQFCEQIKVGKDVAYAKLGSCNCRYLMMKGVHNSSTSNYTNNFSVGMDNYKSYRFAEGYNGAYATALANNTSFVNCEDAPFNTNYNKTHAIAGITAKDADFGYYCYNQGVINSYLTEGCTVELFEDIAKINVAGVRELYVVANGNSFDYVANPGDPYDMTEVESGVYRIKMRNYRPVQYVGPTVSANLANTDFETSATGTSATGFGPSKTTVNGVQNVPQSALNVIKDEVTGNSYGQITNIVDGEMIGGNSRQYGGLHAKYFDVASGDYFTFSFDIMADKYTDDTNLITAEQYNALSDELKATYALSYVRTHYYAEAPYIGNTNSLQLQQFDGIWYITTQTANKDNLDTQGAALSTVAGVWNNVTMAFKTDVNVTYTDANGTHTVSYAAYTAAGNPESATATVTVTSDYKVYVNGEYAFDYAAFDYNNKTYTYDAFVQTADKQAGKSANNRTFRYMQMQVGEYSSSRLTTPISICYDNIRCDRYPDGYNGAFATAFENRASLNSITDSVFNATYNKTGTFIAAVYPASGEMGTSYATVESAYAVAGEGDTIELFAPSHAIYSPLAKVTYVKTNGYEFNINLPEGYTCYETETAGTYVVKVAGPEDMVDVEWIIDGVLYATTKETIGSTPSYDFATKVHPWVTKCVTSWTNDNGGVIKAGKNTFTGTSEYVAAPSVQMNVTTNQAIVTNTYLPYLTEEELAQVSGIKYITSNSITDKNPSGTNTWGNDSWSTVTIGDVQYYKHKDTQRIIYNANGRTATLSFVYDGVELSCTFRVDAYGYFDAVLSSNSYNDVEKELIYSALVYADAVGRYASGATQNYTPLVQKYSSQYAAKIQKTSLADIIKNAAKDTSGMTAITDYGITVVDGYAARFSFKIIDSAKPTPIFKEDGETIKGYDYSAFTLTYKDVRNKPKTATIDYYDVSKDPNLIGSNYDIKIYDMRQTFTITVGEESATFNLAAYIKALVDAGKTDSAEMQIALAIYHYSECSEAYKRS